MTRNRILIYGALLGLVLLLVLSPKSMGTLNEGQMYQKWYVFVLNEGPASKNPEATEIKVILTSDTNCVARFLNSPLWNCVISVDTHEMLRGEQWDLTNGTTVRITEQGVEIINTPGKFN